ncbi:hypothetical protein D9M71_728890 [compost metagenome]
MDHAVEGEIQTVLVPGLQLDDLAGATGGQVQVDPRVVVICHAQVRAHDRRDGVEQSDQVETDVHGGVEVRCQAKAPGLQNFGEHPAPRFEQFIGAVARGSAPAAETEDVEFDASNRDFGILISKRPHLLRD